MNSTDIELRQTIFFHELIRYFSFFFFNIHIYIIYHNVFFFIVTINCVKLYLPNIYSTAYRPAHASLNIFGHETPKCVGVT